MPVESRNGRGATRNATPTRFNLNEREVDGDWRDFVAALDGDRRQAAHHRDEEQPKTILTFNNSPDIGFDRSINAYRGCEHGCIYCFARPTHAYHDLSPGLDFETKLFAKPDAAELLRETLARPGYKPRRSRWAPTPIPTSRSRGATASPGRCSRCASRRAIR